MAQREIRWGTLFSGPLNTVKDDKVSSMHKEDIQAMLDGPGASRASRVTDLPLMVKPEEVSMLKSGLGARSGMEAAIADKVLDWEDAMAAMAADADAPPDDTGLEDVAALL
jgi:hypothetical protein